MLRIAVCDDEQEAVLAHKEATEAALLACRAIGEVVAYTRSDNLFCDIVEDGFHFDLILLDIEMPGRTGMELARELRPSLPHVKIIFITSHVEYAIDAYELSVFRYVPKNDEGKRLFSALTDAILLLMLEDGKVYTIQTSSRLEKIPYREIYFIERDGKNVSITWENGVSRVRASLQQVYEELASEEFLFIDRGCIVNLIHVMQVKNGMVFLENGVSLPVSRSHLQQVKEEINAYWGAHL